MPCLVKGSRLPSVHFPKRLEKGRSEGMACRNDFLVMMSVLTAGLHIQPLHDLNSEFTQSLYLRGNLYKLKFVRRY